MLRDLSKATMSKSNTKKVSAYLSQAGKLFNKISGSTLRQLEKNQDLAKNIETHGNSYVRKGQIPPDPKKRVAALIKFIEDKYKKEADKRKTDKGKAAQKAVADSLLVFFSSQNKKNLEMMFELQRTIVLAKLKLINILQRVHNIDTFVKTRKGFKVTGAEGYVAIDKLGGDAVKIVDRMEFSTNNFSPDILKGIGRAHV